MSAGLPGLGLGGIFFIISALLAPFAELLRATRGRSSPERRREAARHFALAVAMLVAIDLTLRGSLLALSLLGLAAKPHLGLVAMPLVPLGLTTALMCAVLAAAKAMELVERRRRRRRREQRLRRPATAETGS
jgi:hypothetical protein